MIFCQLSAGADLLPISGTLTRGLTYIRNTVLKISSTLTALTSSTLTVQTSQYGSLSLFKPLLKIFGKCFIVKGQVCKLLRNALEAYMCM